MMIRNLRAFGLALIAIFAMTTLVASTASAQQGMLTSDGPVTLRGTEVGEAPDNFKAFGVEVKCPESTSTWHTYHLTPHQRIPPGATTVTIITHPKPVVAGKINCKAAGFPATVDMNGCDHAFHIGTTTGVADTYGATIDIVCPAGKEITLTMFTTEAEDPTTPFCAIHIKEQAGLTGATIRDETNGKLRFSGTITGVHATRTNHGAHSVLCQNNTTTTTGSFAVNDLLEGINEAGGATSISISH